MDMRRCMGLGVLLKCRFLFLVLISHAIVAPAQTSIGSLFPIATGWIAVHAAFDGTNYLVALQTGAVTKKVGAQLISSTGARVGPLIALGRDGQTCCVAVAFDGTHYLMAWEEKISGGPFVAYGQFISTSGMALGQQFAVTDACVCLDGLKFLAYGGGKYLLTYSKYIVPANGGSPGNSYIAGRIISSDGTIGSEFRISSGSGRGSSVGFDGTNFFAVWREDSLGYEVRGRFVSPTGTLGQEISINASPAPSGYPSVVAFDGTNYLVVFHDEVGATPTNPTQAVDVLGQRVSPDGTLVGEVITISNDPGPQWAGGIVFDGAHYLVSWTDMQRSTNWDVYGRYVGKDGTLVGDRFAINTDAGNQWGGVATYANGNYFVVVASGVQFPRGGATADEVSGLFMSGSAPLLTVVNGGTGYGSIASDPIGISCYSPIPGYAYLVAPDCTENYASGTQVTLTATPSTGSTFTGWSGSCTGTGACVIAMNSASSVTANFTSTSAAECLFNWAERTYPPLFAPAGANSTTLEPYYYRYYPQTAAYLGTSSADNHVYYLGPASGNSLLDVGALSLWLSTAGCQ